MTYDQELRSIATALIRRFGDDEDEHADETRGYDAAVFERLESLLADGDEPLIVDYTAETFTRGATTGTLVDEELADIRRRVRRNQVAYGDETRSIVWELVRRREVVIAEPPDEPRSLSLATSGATPISALAAGPVQLRGHAAVFDRSSEDLGGFVERIAPGAFRDILRQQTPVALLNNHDWNTILASTKSATLTLAEDPTGLAVRASLDPGDRDVQRVLPKMRRGDLSGMSFRFKSKRDAWTRDHQGGVLRTVLAIGRMTEVSLCPRPAYPDAHCSLLRSARELIHEQDTAERQRVHTRLRILQLAAPPVAA